MVTKRFLIGLIVSMMLAFSCGIDRTGNREQLTPRPHLARSFAVLMRTCRT